MKRILFILGVLEDEDVDWLVSAGQRQALATNEVLIREGDIPQALHLILSGQLMVSVDRGQPTVIAHLAGGEVVGEMSFVDYLPASATVTAAEPSVVLTVHQSALTAKLGQDVGFASRFYRALAMLLSTRLRGTVRHLEAEYWQPITLYDERYAPEMADNIALGGIRFDWLIRRLRDADRTPWQAPS
ncbi:cyclic nucleotide-binding domain-containing protein [Leptolyngbya sp. PCC 6406]|uniref:cyclic nucleotide-binding domain-containing protein n=1 Tax=Leptolyngbya sp. PCC 6406 TaxID=1173264 RepID=UPI0002AB9C9A|nr:cyclic nucleotide-binding domain-containing protein [Leptolyngbya sp. PCC 6406]